jgi:hypothetical protein
MVSGLVATPPRVRAAAFHFSVAQPSTGWLSTPTNSIRIALEARAFERAM